MEIFPEFWYESNACWGWVRSVDDLIEKIKLQLNESNSINSIDDFLNKSFKTSDSNLNFGTYSEHNSDYTLYQFLIDNSILSHILLEVLKTNKN